MQVKEISKKQIWEKFFSEITQKTFLQSWAWADFNKSMGNIFWRLGVFDNENLIAVCLITKIKAKRGVFLLAPHGPVIGKKTNSSQKIQILTVLLDYLKKIAKQEKASFIRFSPIWEKTEENTQMLSKIGFKQAPIHVHPESSWVLDIKPSEDELLMNMRKTTRYLIKKSLKNKDIEIFKSHNIEDIEVFSRLHNQNAGRQHFMPFSLEYLKNEFQCFSANNQAELFIGKYKDEIIAISFVIFWSGIGFYHHAVLSPKFRNLPISYGLQWEAIKEAKNRGCSFYDFWGYAPPKSRHPWAGPTLFKMGFGGYMKDYVKTQDYVISLKYYPTFLFEKIRKFKRGF